MKPDLDATNADGYVVSVTRAVLEQLNKGDTAIRATGRAKAEAYRVGVEALSPESYTMMQLMQTVGDRNVRIVPDVAVSGAGANPGLVDGLLGLLLRNQANGEPKPHQN